MQNFDFSFFELLPFTRKIFWNLVNSFFVLIDNTEGGLCAKFQAFDIKFDLFTAKKTKFGYFWAVFWFFKPKIYICYLIWKPKFGTNMPLTYWDLYAKFQTFSSKRLAVALPNIPGGPKVQNFETFFYQLWNVFLSFWVDVPLWKFGNELVHLVAIDSLSGRQKF